VLPGAFFEMFYEVVFGQKSGPKFSTFIELVGKEKVVGMLGKICA
jgi:lysyl-tRNA synthetase class I